MLKKILIFLTAVSVLTSNVFSDQELWDTLFPADMISVWGISYDEFNIIDDSTGASIFAPVNRQTIIVSHGWNRNGLLFYTLWEPLSSNEFAFIKNISTHEQISTQHWSRWIPDVAAQFNIEPSVGQIGEFPFIWNGNEYNIFSVIEPEPTLCSYPLTVRIFISRNDTQIRIGTIGLRDLRFFDLAGNEIETIFPANFVAENLRFRYIKSPFQDIIAVVVFSPRLGISWATPYFDYDIFGVHLRVGFD